MDYGTIMQYLLQAAGMGALTPKGPTANVAKNYGKITSRESRGLPDFAQPRSQNELDSSMAFANKRGGMSTDSGRMSSYSAMESNGELDPNYGENFRTMITQAGPQAALAYLLAQQRDFGGDPTAVSRQLGNNDRLQRDLADQLHPSFDWTVPSWQRRR